ncbi:hypothetical protein EV182_000708 [Spiromyces aspiralis]|uniref:Uncharacterized protein n=1 Tax=Spiromyces aspiralis TaxID=68401 RepID=A0ACC1HWP7_9FUNG|nr:hypothetical protein EV182_000708 [Spiromyces aspiralis]
MATGSSRALTAWLLLLLLFAQECLAASAPSRSQFQRRIVGGTEVSDGEAPFMVRVSIDNGHTTEVCGGAILSDRFVVTAAHCLVPVDPSQQNIDVAAISIGVGSTVSTQLEHLEALDVAIHPEYNPETYRNDIGVIRVAPLDLATRPLPIRPARISILPVKEGQRFRAFGWGSTSPGDMSPSPSLRATTLKAGSLEACADGYYYFDPKTTICMQVSQTPGNDTCSGDSGGPLVDMDGNLVGITSYAVNNPQTPVDDCGSDSGMGYYTYLRAFLSYLSSETGLSLTANDLDGLSVATSNIASSNIRSSDDGSVSATCIVATAAPLPAVLAASLATVYLSFDLTSPLP